MFCPRCGLGQPSDHDFCLSCGTRLPKHLLPVRGHKVSRWFAGVPIVSGDAPDSMLRVSRYLEEFDLTTAEGSVRVPSGHVRFSIWVNDRATCAVSVPDHEVEELVRFLAATADGENPHRELSHST